MKKIVLGISLLAVSLASAQKKEINNALKAVESNDIATTNNELFKAENLLENKFYLLEPSTLEQYYYAKGVALIKGGKVSEGAEFLGKINDLKTIYVGKDANKNKVYFVGKESAEKSNIEGLKPEIYTPKTTEKVSSLVGPLLKSSGDEAFAAYQRKDYNKSAGKYLETYNLLKAIGTDDKLYLYYTAISYTLANKKAEAIAVYSDLINEGYTGVSTQYFATDVKTGKVQAFDKNSYELIKKTGSKEYKDLKIEQTPSVELELYETCAGLLLETERYEEAVALTEKGLKRFPKSNRLSQIQGNAYYKSGKTEQFIHNLKQQLTSNPNDKEAWYNLGYLQSQDEKTLMEAEKSFNKALEIDPKYDLALQGIIYEIYLKNDDKVVDEIRVLQKAKKTDEQNKLMEIRRAKFKKVLPYLEKWYAIEPKNIDVVRTLKGVYMTLDREDKYNEFKKIEDSLK